MRHSPIPTCLFVAAAMLISCGDVDRVHSDRSPETTAECTYLVKPPQSARLFEAMQTRDIDRIDAAIERMHPGQGAPAPETPDQFVSPDPRAYAKSFSDEELVELAGLYIEKSRAESWWLRDVPPSEAPSPLRAPATMIRGLLAIAEGFPEHRHEAIALVSEAADYLLQASEDSGFPGAPFPYWRDRDGRLGGLSEKLAGHLEACGKLEQSVVNDWFVVPGIAEEYYFDTGRVGEAIAEIIRVHPDTSYQTWAMEAAAWLDDKPISTNFNYNAFIVGFFADLAMATDDDNLHKAVDLAFHGVLSGMTQTGEDAGHWRDAHNERVVYRTIMVRYLIQLAEAVALSGNQEGLRAEELYLSTSLALHALEADMRKAGGIASPEEMIEIYLDLDAAILAGARLASSDQSVRRDVFAIATEAFAKGQFPASSATGRALTQFRSRR